MHNYTHTHTHTYSLYTKLNLNCLRNPKLFSMSIALAYILHTSEAELNWNYHCKAFILSMICISSIEKVLNVSAFFVSIPTDSKCSQAFDLCTPMYTQCCQRTRKRKKCPKILSVDITVYTHSYYMFVKYSFTKAIKQNINDDIMHTLISFLFYNE